MADRQVARACEIHEPKGPVEILPQELRCSPPLASRKAPAQFSASPSCCAVAVEDMCADEQLELVEGQWRRSSLAAQVGQKALRDLREDDVVLTDGHAKAAHALVAERRGH